MKAINKETLKQLPKIDELMLILKSQKVFNCISRDVALQVCRDSVGQIRRDILTNNAAAPSEKEILALILQRIEKLSSYRLRPVINATGVILHTNLGRAPLCREALNNLIAVGRGYSNVEFDLEKGKRGSRYDHLRDLLRELTGAEDAIVVNNKAAAVLLALNSMAAGKEVVVSRGELIEIGGEFRIPEVMEKSNALLREVGTTNKTYAADYERSITDKTGLLFKAHTSNFKIVGFTAEVSLEDLVALGNRYGLPVMHDLGSGCLIDLKQYGMEREPTVREAVASGADIITFSGDKLLGGPQAGIIVGKKDWIRVIAQNPLNRALRIDKLTIAALEATLQLYMGGDEKAISHIEALRNLTEPLQRIEKKAKKLLKKMKALQLSLFSFACKKDFSMAGGGSLPGQKIPTFLISMRSDRISPNSLETAFRNLDTPVVVRISEDEVLFDLRTISENDFPGILNGIQKIAGQLFS